MFFHGSRRQFADGVVLSPQADGYVHQDDVREFEALVEARRPQGCRRAACRGGRACFFRQTLT